MSAFHTLRTLTPTLFQWEREKEFALLVQCASFAPSPQPSPRGRGGNNPRCADEASAFPGSLIFQNRFSIDRDLDRVADDEAASVHGVVPTDAKVLAVD